MSCTYVIHDLSTGNNDQWFGTKLAGILEKIIYRLPLQRIITVSSNVKQRLINDYNKDSKRVYVIHNGVDKKLIDSVPAQRKVPNQIIFIGRLIPHKHVDDLIEILKLDKELKLIVVGSGPEEKILKALSRGVRNRVRFLGTVPDTKKLIVMIKQSQCLVLPSTREGFGMVLVEAMCSGTNVIAYHSDGANEVLDNNKTGLLVPPRNIQALFRGIRKIIHESKWAAEVAKMAKDKAVREFNWDKSAELLERLYLKHDIGKRKDNNNRKNTA